MILWQHRHALQAHVVAPSSHATAVWRCMAALEVKPRHQVQALTHALCERSAHLNPHDLQSRMRHTNVPACSMQNHKQYKPHAACIPRCSSQRTLSPMQFESGAILLYLAEKCGEASSLQARATAAKWALFANSTMANGLFMEQVRHMHSCCLLGKIGPCTIAAC